MSIQVTTPGAPIAAQDLGRNDYQTFDVPVSGVMDLRVMRLANILCDNPGEETVFECILLSPTLEFTVDNVIALIGGGLGAILDRQPLVSYGVYAVKNGQTLRFTVSKTGCRAHLTFHGGLDTPPVTGSRSIYLKAKFDGFSDRKLEKGDELDFRAPMTAIPNLDVHRFTPGFASREVYTLRVILGSQDDAFSEGGLQTFLSETHTVTPEFDRMDYRLNGAAVTYRNGADIISGGIAFSAIQVPASGTSIVTLTGRWTTGGYTKTANVISADFHLLAQLKVNDKVRSTKASVAAVQDAKHAERDALRVFTYAFGR